MLESQPMTRRFDLNGISEEARPFLLAAWRATEGIERALECYVAFCAMDNEVDAETARQNARDNVDAYCDAIRSATKTMGGL